MHWHEEAEFWLAGEVADSSVGAVVLADLAVQLNPGPLPRVELCAASKSYGAVLGREGGREREGEERERERERERVNKKRDPSFPSLPLSLTFGFAEAASMMILSPTLSPREAMVASVVAGEWVLEEV